MRVTANTFPDSLIAQLNSLNVRQNQLQTQASTGQRIQLPEDDPTSMRRVLDLQTESASVSQYSANIANLTDTAQATYSVMNGLKTILDRARELATQADGTRSPADLKAYATELTQLIEHAVQLTQTKYKGSYLFGGTQSDQAPFVLAQDANGFVTSVTYQGNQSLPQSEIAQGVTLSAQVVGANTTGAGPRGLIADSRFGADLFNHLISLQNNLVAGNTSAIASTDRAALGQDEDNILFHISDNGALQARLEASASVATSTKTSLTGSISKEADADLAQTLVRLTQTQNAYQAALQSGAKLLSTSLLDYLQ